MGDDDDDQGDAEGAMNVVKYPVMPSLVALQQMRNRLHLAFLGRKLMKWTAMATGKEQRRLAMEIGPYLVGYREEVIEAYMLLARCRYFIDNMNFLVLESMPPTAILTVSSASRSVSGVKVRNLTLMEVGVNGYQYLGLSRGGHAIKKARDAWLALIKKMVFICQFRVTFDLIDIAHKNATKKQNVLQRNIIPRIVMTMRYILSELDEQEREESFRLKRFKQLKYKNVAEAVPKLEEGATSPPPKTTPRPPTPPPKTTPPSKATPPPTTPALPPPVKVSFPPPEKEAHPGGRAVGGPPTTPPFIIPPPPSPVVVPPSLEPEPVYKDPLEVLIDHLTKGLELVEEVTKAEIPAQVSGITQCDLKHLKNELAKILKRREAPDKDKIDDTCSCKPTAEQPIEESQPILKPGSFWPKFKVQTKIFDYILKPGPPLAPEPEIIKDHLEELEANVNQVICMTNYYKCEGLLSKSTEDFLKCCESVKTKIQEHRCQKKIKKKLDTLKEQVTNLEKITDIVQREDLSSTTISSFMSCCKEFKIKLDKRKSCKGPPSVQSIEKLINQIGDSIALSNEAKKEGLLCESVEKFIESCIEIKSKIDPTHEPKPQVIEDLLFNINDITDFISKYKDGGSMSESIEKFYLTCQATKEKLESYNPPKASTCAKNNCPNTCPNIEPVTSSINESQAPSTPCGQSSEDSKPICTESIRTLKSEKSSQAKLPKRSKSTCSCKSVKQESQRSFISKSSHSSKSKCNESICSRKSAKQGSQRSCTSKSSRSSKPKCTPSTCSLKISKQESQRSCTSKSTQSCKLPCNESTCSHAKQELQSSRKSKSFQDCNNICTEFTCGQNTAKQESQSSYKSNCCLANAPESFKTNECTAAQPSKLSQKSCSAIIIPIEENNKQDQKECKSSKCAAPETSSSSTKCIGTCLSFTTILGPIEGKDPKESCSGKTEDTVTTIETVKRFKEKDGSIVEQTISVKQRIIGPENLPSETSSYATGSCESVKSSKTVNVCEVPVTRGFIQTVRNVKSETLIRTQNLSRTCPPFVWSCVSADALGFDGGSNEIENVQQDPFFCGSLTSNDDADCSGSIL